MKVFFIQYKGLPRVGRSGFAVEFIVVGFQKLSLCCFSEFFPRGSGIVLL